jgi:methanogenic corrinoid protein MtbC1
MGLLTCADRPPWLPRAGSVIVACVEGEAHALGARMVADFFIAAGWSTHFLGASVPTNDLVAFTHVIRPDVVALSCTLPRHLPALHETAARLRLARGDTASPRILAGGQALEDAAALDGDHRDRIENNIHRALALARDA